MRILFVAAFAIGLLSSAPAMADSAEINGAVIHYDSQGSGEPLLMLHGFGSCAADWGEAAQELSKSYRVISVDARGHGRSTNPSGKFSHPQAAEDVLALMDKLDIKQARAIGFSSGGMTLLQLATKHPERLSKMVVIGASSHFPEPTRAMLRGMTFEAMPPFVQQIFRNCATRGDSQVREIVSQFRAFGDSKGDMELDATDLARIKASTLIVHGDRDEFFPVAIPVAMYGAIPKAELWIVPGGDHSPTAGAEPAQFAKTIEAFLAK